MNILELYIYIYNTYISKIYYSLDQFLSLLAMYRFRKKHLQDWKFRAGAPPRMPRSEKPPESLDSLDMPGCCPEHHVLFHLTNQIDIII